MPYLITLTVRIFGDMSRFEFISHFSGCGGASTGAKMAGFELLGAVEWMPEIAELYRANLGDVTVGDISQVKPLGKYFSNRENRVLILQTSPPCQEFSEANKVANPDSTRGQILASTYDWYLQLEPEYVVLENVPYYKHAKVYKDFEKFLESMGYTIRRQDINAADYGVPSARLRYIMIAAKKGYPLPELTPTHSDAPGQLSLFSPVTLPWVSWYEATKDLHSTLSVSSLTENQQATLERYGVTTALVDRCSKDRRLTHFRPKHEPSYTLTTQTKYKIHLDGTTLQVDNRVLARLQSFPDWYNFDCPHSLARTAIGNSVPPLLMKAICGAVREMFP